MEERCLKNRARLRNRDQLLFQVCQTASCGQRGEATGIGAIQAANWAPPLLIDRSPSRAGSTRYNKIVSREDARTWPMRARSEQSSRWHRPNWLLVGGPRYSGVSRGLHRTISATRSWVAFFFPVALRWRRGRKASHQNQIRNQHNSCHARHRKH